jgi:DNA-binding CsgD family transcriptional regulator/tetratricopeptide (TPR) repeat protein
MDLLERDFYLAELNAALQETRSGAGRLVLVSGEAGIGKTSLVEQFARIHRDTLRVLWGNCDSHFTPRPFGPLYDMSSQIQGDLPALLASAAPHSAIFPAVLAVLQKSRAVIIFEDVHLADEATLDLLRYLGRRLTQTSVLFILTYRDDELGPRHPLRIVLGDIAPPSVTRRLLLPPLTEKAVRTMVGERGLDPHELHHQTGGNPFFVTEVLASPASGIPHSIRDAVLARAGALSPSGYAVLEAAAVIGLRVEAALLAKVMGEEGQAADECIAAGILLAQEDALVFRHELGRQSILNEISPLRSRALNRRVLEALKSSPATRNDLARLAHHAEAAGDPQAVLEFAPAAARQASAASAHREAAALYKLALRYFNDLPRHEHAQILQLYAQECNSIDDRMLGIQILHTALDLWRELQDRLNQGLVLSQMSNMFSGLGQDENAMQCAREAISILETFPPGQELASAYRARGSLELVNLNLTDAILWFEKSISLASQLSDTTEFYAAQAMLGSTLMHLDYEQGCRHMERTLVEATAADERAVVALIYANLGSVSCELHHFRRAEKYLKAGLVYGVQHDLDRLKFYMQAWLAFTQLNLCQWNEAAEGASIVIRDARRSVTSRLTALTTLGRLRARRGDPEANKLLDEALELTREMGSIDRLGPMRIARAEVAWLAGNLQKTIQEGRAIYELAIRKKHPWYAGELAFWLWRAGEKIAPADWMAGPFRLQINGDWKGAAKEWEALGCPYEQAQSLADGDLAARKTALAIFERIGAHPAAEKLRQMLQAAAGIGLPPKPRVSTRQNPFGLTHRQVEILGLLIDGLTNAEIAGRLQITSKTADHHVSAILEKLDVHSRDSAANMARQHPYFKK